VQLNRIGSLVDKLKFFHREEVEGWTAVRTFYDLTYKSKIGTIIDLISRASKAAHVVGPGSTFRYNNADHFIEMGLMLGRPSWRRYRSSRHQYRAGVS
jgi:hypothetical protein